MKALSHGILQLGLILFFWHPASVAPAEDPPWGSLTVTDLYLPAPDEILDLAVRPSENTEWHFHAVSRETLIEWLDQAGIWGPAFPEMHPSRWLFSEDHIVLTPRPATVLALTPEARQTFYGTLARWEENEPQRSPAAFPRSQFTSWFAGSGLPDARRALVEGLLYERDGLAFFADAPLLMAQAESAGEEDAILRLLSLRHTLLIHLTLPVFQDLTPVVAYWSVGERGKEMGPLLRAFAAEKNREILDIAHLLPPTPRRQLYRFPVLRDARGGRFPDAVWTALNFFQDQPRDIYGDSADLNAHLQTHYQALSPETPLRFGDVILFRRQPEAEPLHAAVYLADDLVYSRHSAEPSEPWVILPLGEMLSRRGLSDSLGIREAWRGRETP